MELKMSTQTVPGTLPEVLEWNHEELKAEVAAKAQEYKAIAYTEEQVAEMKKDRATLNKLIKAFEDQRKQVKKMYLAPYDKFDAQVKDVLAPVREAIQIIDSGLAEIDRKYREDRTARMQELYDTYAGGLKSLIPFQRTVIEDCYKKSTTDKKLEKYYVDFFDRVREEIAIITKQLAERFQSKAMMKYVETLSLSDALREGERLEEMEAAMEERRRKQEEAARAKAEAEQEEKRKTYEEKEARRQAEEAEKERMTLKAAEQKQEELDLHPRDEEIRELKQEEAEAPTEEEIKTLDFRAWGTQAQIMGLRDYMIQNGIRFGKVE